MKPIFKSLLLAVSFSPLALLAMDTDGITQGLTSDDYDLRQETLNQLNSQAAHASDPAAEAGAKASMEAILLAQAADKQLDDETRIYYLRALQKVITPDGLQPLFALIAEADSSDWLKEECFACMTKLSSDDAVDAILESMLKAPDSQIENYWSVLARIKSPHAVTPLIKYLKSGKLDLSQTALLTVSSFANADLVEFLYDTWKDADEDARAPIAQALLVTEQASEKQLEKLLDKNLPTNLVVAAYKQLLKMDEAKALKLLTTLLSEKPDQTTPLIRVSTDVGTESIWQYLQNHAGEFSPANLAALLSAASENKRVEFEALALEAINSDKQALQKIAIQCLGVIGTSTASAPLLAMLNSEDKDIVETSTLALATLNDPGLDATMLEMVKSMSASAADAIKVLAIRNSPGSLELLNKMLGVEAPKAVEKELIEAVVNIGDSTTCKLLILLVLQAKNTSEARVYQLALKRLSLRLEQPEPLWEDCYLPALALAADDATQSRIVVILDALPIPEVLAYCIEQSDSDSTELSKAAEQALMRWQTLEVCDYWIEKGINNRQADEAAKKIAIQNITRTLAADYIREDPNQRAAKGVELFTSNSDVALREAILKTFAKLEEWPRKSFAGQISPYLSVADYKDQIETLAADN